MGFLSTELLAELLLLLAAATAGVALFERLRLPSIAGFLVMGALLGPGGIGLISDPESVASLAELGVVFLLFEIGLELPLERLRRTWRKAVVAGRAQPDTELIILDNGQPIGSAKADLYGLWTFVSAAALESGRHEIALQIKSSDPVTGATVPVTPSQAGPAPVRPVTG